jgi:biotin carboxylase
MDGLKGKRLIILGAGIMQGPAISIAKELGLETVVLDGDPNAVYASLGDRFEPIDLKNREGIEEFARSLQEAGGLSGIMTAGTDFSAAVAWVAERLGLPGLPYEAALNASDKGRMRRCFKEAGVPSPDFLTLDKLPKADFALPFDFPAVVKPVDNMGGRGCRRADSRAELEEALGAALKFSRSGRVIVEEYMDGPEFSIDALVYHGEITFCGLADRHIRFPPYFIEMGHTIPANLKEASASFLLKTFTHGVRALGLLDKNAVGAAKGDVKLTSSGPMIGEIAARLSGGYMSGWTYPYASGVEVTRGAILAALGQKPGGLVPSRNWTCAERAFISIPGKVRSITGLRNAKNAPYVKDLFLRAASGNRVVFPENNVTKCGNILAAAPDRAAAVAAAQGAAGQVLIRLEAPDAETEAFLSGASPSNRSRSTTLDFSRRPPAFAVSGILSAELTRLPETTLIPGALPEETALVPFPSFSASSLKDWMGRGVEESLGAVRELTGLALPERPCTPEAGDSFLGREFWTFLIRGGYQGAVYMIDLIFAENKGNAS